jgi:peptide/nickel transport system substrate-binding protein
VAALLVALLSLVTGCGASHRPPAPGGAGVADLNPRPRQEIRDGGELRWPLAALPTNFNALAADGATVATRQVVDALLPRLFIAGQDGRLVREPDYLDSAELVSTHPQVVSYRINPRAQWSTGVPVTWRDFEGQWRACGGDPAYRVASHAGYADIASVRPGVSNQQVIVTFARPFAEWQTLFTPLYPAQTGNDPDEFNTGWVDDVPASAGPFRLGSLDRAGGTVTLTRNERWWGRAPKLDRIVFRVVPPSALPPALADGRLDFYPIGSDADLLAAAQSIPGVAIRQSPDRSYDQLTFNGAPGGALADVRLRRALAQGIDRGALASQLIGRITPTVTQLGNMIYPFGSPEYRDHSDELRYDPAAAQRTLDALGWTRPGGQGLRTRGGTVLRLRLVEPSPDPVGRRIDAILRYQLARIGVEADIVAVPVADAVAVLRSGDFDLATFAWRNTALPLSSVHALYARPGGPDGRDIQQNYGRI